MSLGDIILARLQQSDGQIKKRPALVLAVMPPYNDLLICAVSTQLRQCVEGFDEVIAEADSDFELSGLKLTSVVRVGMVATIPRNAALGELGSIPKERLNRLRSRLADHIKAVE